MALVALPYSSTKIFATSLSRYQKYHSGDGETLKQKIVGFHEDEREGRASRLLNFGSASGRPAVIDAWSEMRFRMASFGLFKVRPKCGAKRCGLPPRKGL